MWTNLQSPCMWSFSLGTDSVESDRSGIMLPFHSTPLGGRRGSSKPYSCSDGPVKPQSRKPLNTGWWCWCWLSAYGSKINGTIAKNKSDSYIIFNKILNQLLSQILVLQLAEFALKLYLVVIKAVVCVSTCNCLLVLCIMSCFMWTPGKVAAALAVANWDPNKILNTKIPFSIRGEPFSGDLQSHPSQSSSTLALIQELQLQIST